MKKHSLDKMDLDVYHERLDNGMDVYIVPKGNVNGYYVTLSTKYGSIHDEFVPIDNIFPLEEKEIALIAFESTIRESILNEEGS